jgi:hypothetical protein
LAMRWDACILTLNAFFYLLLASHRVQSRVVWTMRSHLSGEQMRQKSIEAELRKRRLQSNRFNMKGYSMHLRQLPKDGTLAVASSKLIVKNVQNFKVLCHAENMIDDDDAMIESALMSLAASKRQKDRAPSSMILHRHLQNQNYQQFSLQQNSIVHQKLQGKSDPETEIIQVLINNPAVSPPAPVVSTINDKKPLVTTTYLQLFDLDSSRSGRTNECCSGHAETSRRIEVYTPVKKMLAGDQNLRMKTPDRPVGLLIPTLMARAASQSQNTYNPSSPILELAAPYSKNFVENYKSKIRHSRLGPLFGSMQLQSVPRSERQVKSRGNSATANTLNQQELSLLDGTVSPFQKFQRLPTAESYLMSTPSRGSHNDSEDSFDGDIVFLEQINGGQVAETRSFGKADLDIDACEAIERERMLEQVQKMYSHVSIVKDAIKSKAVDPKRSMSHLRERLTPMAESSKDCTATAEFKAVQSAKQTAALRNVHVVIPHNEELFVPAKVPLAVDQYVKTPKTIAIVPSPYRMSVNILRPFESIVDIAQSQCISPFNMTKNNHHSTPVEVMLASASILNLQT